MVSCRAPPWPRLPGVASCLCYSGRSGSSAPQPGQEPGCWPHRRCRTPRVFEEGALTAPSPTPTLHSASSSTVPCSETLLPGPCPQLRGQLDRALRWGQRHGLPRLLSVQLIGPRRAGSGCPCLRLWPSSGWVGSSWWAAKDRGGGGLQQWKASSRLQAGVQLRVSWGLRRTARHPGSPASLVVAASSCLGLCPLHGCLLCLPAPSPLLTRRPTTGSRDHPAPV